MFKAAPPGFINVRQHAILVLRRARFTTKTRTKTPASLPHGVVGRRNPSSKRGDSEVFDRVSSATCMRAMMKMVRSARP